MRSTFLLLAWGAVSTAFADTCNDVDSQSLLQSRKLVRAHKKTTAANDLLKSVREVANTFTADSTVTMTPAEVNAAIGTASTALQTMLPMFAEQHDLAQREINDALAAVQVCHDQNRDERVRLEQAVARQLAVKNECQATLNHLVEAENEACARAEDCLCDEARVETNGQRIQCATITEEYDSVFCESQHLCNTFQQCHSGQMDIYSDLRAAVEAEMIVRQTEYRTYVQVDCIMNLITAAMLSGTPIPDASLVACDNANADQFALDFPEPPSAPTACPATQHGDPHCDGALPIVFNPHLDAAPLTCVDSLTTSTPTGWNRPANVIQYGEVGLVGHYWHALEVDFQFCEPMAFTGVETDYSQNPYSVFSSMDGSTWTEVASGVIGSQTFSEHSVGLYARLRWEDTHGVNGIHARFLGVAMPDAPTVFNPHLDAAPLTADSLTTSTPTGWNRPANVIQYGEVGLVGHYWHALEVDFQFSEPMAFTGVETDYSQNPYNVFTSMDGSTWTEVASGVTGSETFSEHSVGLYARLRWEDTHGVNGIHARFLGVARH